MSQMLRFWQVVVVLAAAVLVNPASGATLTGRVVEDHSGSPVVAAAVRVLVAGTRNILADMDTGDGGQFQIADLSAGEYWIDVAKPGHLDARLSVRIADGGPSPAPVLVWLARLGAIAGRLTDQQGKPVPGGLVFSMVKPGSTGFFRPYRAPVSADSQGWYRLYDLPPGQYAVATAYGYSNSGSGAGVQFYPSNSSPRTFTILGGEEYSGIDFAIASTSRSRVTGAVEASAPGTRFVVSLVPVDQSALLAATQITLPDGTFRFEGIASGSYHLLASGPASGGRSGFAVILGSEPLFGRTQIEVAGIDLEGVSIPMRSGLSVPFALRPATPEQSPSACPKSATLVLSPLEAWGAKIGGSIEVTFVGEQNVGGLAPGRYYASVTAPGDGCYGPVDMIIDSGGPIASRPVKIPMSPAGSIQGRMRAGSARPSDFIVVLLPSGQLAGAEPLRVASPDAESRFAFKGLRPGIYHIAARPAAETSNARLVSDFEAMFEVEIVGGAPTDMDIPIPAPAGNLPEENGGRT